MATRLTIRKMKMRTWILLVSIAFSCHALAEYPTFWKQSAYAIECKDSNLKEVMEDFSHSFGVLLEMDEQVGGSCQGWLRGDNAVSFLDALSYKYQFQWYVFRQTLYISRIGDTQTIRLKVDPNIKVALRDLGLYQEKFGWGDIGELDVALISGPQSYIDQVKALLDMAKDKPANKKHSQQGVYVIPVKYASVADRTITVRGKDTVVPGIATIISQVLGNIGTSNSFSKDPTLDDSVQEKGAKLLSNIGGSKISIQADIRTNSLVIKSPDKMYNKVYFERLINQLDKPQKMIEIDAIIVDIDKEKLFELGVRGFEKIANLNYGFRFPQQSIAPNSTLFVNNPGKFTADLKALEGNGDASIIANTSILTMENQSAIIDLSETFFLQTVGERVANINPYTTGTLLNVTPQYIQSNEGNRIKLVVEIEDGKFVRDASASLPTINKSNVSTTAIIDQNQALVIGGYHVEERTKNVNKLPIFGDIPLLGNLFKVKSKKHSQRERIFIITPRISPTRHRGESYSYFGDDKRIAKSLQKIKQRWIRANQQYAEIFVDQVHDYVRYETIPNFEQNKTTAQPFKCHQEDIQFEFINNQMFSGEGIDIYLGKAINGSSIARHLNEKSCYGRGLIGVTFIDDRELVNQTDFSRVLVAVESARTGF